MPASASWRMVSRRFVGVAARGSIRRASRGSSVVTDIATLARPRSAIGAEDVDVARDQMRLGDDADRMVRPAQHLEDAAGDAELALDRLVGVGVGAHGDAAAL